MFTKGQIMPTTKFPSLVIENSTLYVDKLATEPASASNCTPCAGPNLDEWYRLCQVGHAAVVVTLSITIATQPVSL